MHETRKKDKSTQHRPPLPAWGGANEASARSQIDSVGVWTLADHPERQPSHQPHPSPPASPDRQLDEALNKPGQDSLRFQHPSLFTFAIARVSLHRFRTVHFLHALYVWAGLKSKTHSVPTHVGVRIIAEW
jgi:hypothetical protein